MFGTHFYNQSLRRLTIAFGQIFNNIVVQTKSSTGAVTKRMRVPLAYAPKEKFMTRLEQQANLDKGRTFAITLPRMGFELVGLKYDPNRKLNKLQKTVRVKSSDSTVHNFNYTPVPYDISFNLYSFTATAENGLQIIEQILPYFQPDYTVTINAIPELNIKRDVPIILNNVDYADTYDGGYNTRRAVVYTLSFTAKTYLYGPMSQSKVIRKSQSDIYTDTDTINKAREERIITIPKPESANADDDFGFTTTISFFNDTKNYNPTTGNDE
ncbi:MAG: hypothetical protein CMO44_13480 [Verrucomicrobiales bacterium]|nr:hypothetical protein [Verrucomicrobiales bacterium]